MREGAGGLPWLLAGAVAGPALQLQQAQLWDGWNYIIIGVIGLILIACAATKKIADLLPRGTVPVLLLAGAALLLGATCGQRAQARLADVLVPSLEGRDIAVTGIVAAMPHRNEAGLRFRLAVESAYLDGEPVTLPPDLLLGWYATSGGAGPADLRAGERWQMTVRLKAPHGQRNPHGFDYELWLWEQGIRATGYVRDGPRDAQPRRIGDTWRHPVERARQAVRDAILERIADRRLAGTVAALVTGDQAAIERADWDIFRATGVAHLMSISGLHITLFAWAAGAVVGALWRRRAALCLALPAQHAALAGGVALAAAYAVFSGWGVPAQRTVWMLCTAALLRWGGLRWPWPMAWLLACAVVVTLDPWALLQAGFWLSFVAVGVLFATDAAAANAGAVQAGPVRLTGRFALMLREQLVVTVALTPLALLLFGQVSVVGLPANLVAIPWVTLVVTPLAMLGVLAPPLWDAAALAVQALAWLLQGLASLPFATVAMAAPPLWAAVAAVVGGALLVMPWPWSLRVLGLPLLLPVLLWQPARPAPGQFDLLAADVGQGNAVLVRTATHTLVYDAGPRYSAETDAGHRVLVPLLRALGERVDTLVLSHRDIDHTGGAAAVLAMQPQAELLSSIEDGHPLQALRPARRCVAGQHWVWDGVRFEVLHPLAVDYAAMLKPNGISCVLRVGNGAATALLAGDVEAPQEAALVARHAAVPSGAGGASGALHADVLLVPHHGSKTSSTGAFLDAVAPRLALVQAGYRNRFGHPAPDVLDRYRARGIRVAASPGCGAARWRSDAPQVLRCERDEARRYWHHGVDHDLP